MGCTTTPEGDGKLTRLVRRDARIVEPLARVALEKVLREHPIYQLDAHRSAEEAKTIRHLRSVPTDGSELVLEVGL